MQLFQQTAGIRTWISYEPVLDAESVLFYIKKNDVDKIKIGKLNYQKSNINWKKFGHAAEKLCLELGRNYYIKDSLRALM